MSLAEAQPLVLGFEDLHWAEEPLLDLVEHLADRIDDAPVLIVCLARPELLESRPGWGGGRRRSIAIDLGPLPESRHRDARRRARRRRRPAGRRPAGSARQDGGQPALRRGDRPDARRAARGRLGADPGHGAGADRVADRPASARLALGRPPRCARRPRVLARCGRRPRPGARRRHRARRPRRTAAPHPGAHLDRLGRDRVPVPSRADPRCRVHGPRKGRAGAAAPGVRRVAPRTIGRRARGGAGVPPRARGGALGRARGADSGRPPSRGGRRPRARGLPRARPRGEPHRARLLLRAIELEPSLERSSTPRGPRGGCGSFRRRRSRWRTSARSRRRPGSARSRASRSPSSPRSTSTGTPTSSERGRSAWRRSSCCPTRRETRGRRR